MGWWWLWGVRGVRDWGVEVGAAVTVTGRCRLVDADERRSRYVVGGGLWVWDGLGLHAYVDVQSQAACSHACLPAATLQV